MTYYSSSELFALIDTPEVHDLIKEEAQCSGDWSHYGRTLNDIEDVSIKPNSIQDIESEDDNFEVDIQGELSASLERGDFGDTVDTSEDYFFSCTLVISDNRIVDCHSFEFSETFSMNDELYDDDE